MTRRIAQLGLVILAMQAAAYGLADRFSGGLANQQNSDGRFSRVLCSIAASDTTWRVKKMAGTVTTKIEIQAVKDISVMPALHLIALPKKQGLDATEFWAPFDMSTGASTKEWLRIRASAKNAPIVIQLSVSELKWASAKSSVWPSRPFAKTVPPGQYSLQAQLEFSEGQPISSNEIVVTVSN